MADYSVRRIHNLSIAVGIAGSCLTAVASIPAIRAVIARYQLKKENDLYQSLCQLYQDEDGHATELFSVVNYGPSNRWRDGNTSPLLMVSSLIVAGLSSCYASVSLPRRPELYLEGKPVDYQFTDTFFGRISFSWAGPLLKSAIKNQTSEIDNLPALDYATRFTNLRDVFDKAKKPGEKFLENAYAWVWVFALGGSILLSSTVESWLYWVAQYQLGIPVYEQLSGVVFAKVIRRKDVKGREQTNGQPEQGDKQDHPQGPFDGLMGWRALGAGLLVSVVITPINIYTAKRYNSSQNTLMDHRDRKMGVVAEALQGIRQVKFSALESQWEQKIFAVREAELSAQWPTFTPWSFSLAVLPELIADFVEGFVSTERIGKYSESSERAQKILPTGHISFEKSTVTWPTENLDYKAEQFMLRDMNINFPSKGLSVISGKTGSGKNLLLAAILGEADVLQGVIRAPVPPPLEDKFDIHLENDAIKYVGTLVELRRTGTLSEILAEEDTKEEAKKSSPSPAFHKQSAEGDSANAQTGVQGQTKEPPRKFQQEEGREIGVVKLINYVKYLQNGGELPL
ncbi:hypothetical protein A7D00_2415 [Trichophyton violaceum]|uniref:ABC transmembrane type-1 domain-containing protein n=1 Tax=Trichophyton violaceum TaxID=34388 RepID=A0A178FPF6_TRIVO|nr:hypothetical protein A7D00_2415 [Trichophyton violaceum]